jgi:hypothetical protein
MKAEQTKYAFEEGSFKDVKKAKSSGEKTSSKKKSPFFVKNMHCLKIMGAVYDILKKSYNVELGTGYDNWRFGSGFDEELEAKYSIHFPHQWFSYIDEDGDETVLYKIEFSDFDMKEKTVHVDLCGNPKYIGSFMEKELELSVEAIKKWVMKKISMRTEAQYAKGEGYYS